MRVQAALSAGMPKLVRAMPAGVLFAAVALVCLSMEDFSSAEESMPEGFVYNLRGIWISSKTSRAVQIFDGVHAGEEISTGHDVDSNSVMSISLHEGTSKTLRCRATSDCDAPYTIPPVRPKPEPLWVRLWQSL